jgi:hypothetical protein
MESEHTTANLGVENAAEEGDEHEMTEGEQLAAIAEAEAQEFARN